MIPLPGGEPTSEQLADWLELEVIFGSDGNVTEDAAAKLFSEKYGDDETDERRLEEDTLAQDDGEGEVDERDVTQEMRTEESEGISPAMRRVADLFMEVSFRSQVVGSAYPIGLEEGVARRLISREDDPLYAFLALVGARLDRGLDIPFHEPARLFEEVVAEALGAYVGGESLRFGWPAKEGERNEEFVVKARQLARRLREPSHTMRNVGPDAKDYHLDVVAWRSLRDHTPDEPTPGQIVVLGQCGIGQDWNEKSISVPSWKKVIDFAVPPVGALAFPHVPSRLDGELHILNSIASEESIPFDRLRIASLITSDDLPGDLSDRLADWIGRFYDRLPNV